MTDATTNCPMCGQINEPSGLLGRRIHYCCRACGWWYSIVNDCVETDDAPEEAA
jgi:hypothetical protein